MTDAPIGGDLVAGAAVATGDDQRTIFPPLTNPFYRPVDLNRLPQENFDVEIEGHSIGLSLGRHPRTRAVLEISLRHPKSGSGLEAIFDQLATAITRAIQGRDPTTGAPIERAHD